MNNHKDAMQYIEAQEATEISYVKVSNNNKNLIVNFASNDHSGFEGKTSLMKLKYERNDLDVLFLRNQFKWYLGGLNGIGKNINHTLAFLKKEFAKYDVVLCAGISSGGYASLLFGSILKVNEVITFDAQTDLEYCIDNLSQSNFSNGLKKQKSLHFSTWSKYNKVAESLNDDVLYNAYYRGDGNCIDKDCKIVHGDYHYDLIKDFPSLNKFNSNGYDLIPKLRVSLR